MERTEEPERVYLDTHVVMWLYDGMVELLSDRAVRAIEGGTLVTSGMVELELQYLYEIGRIRPKPVEVLGTLAGSIELRRSDLPLARIASRACALDWTRDPFDRLIAAEAQVAGAALVTKDEAILRNLANAVW